MIPMTRETALDFFVTIYHGKHHLPSDLRDDGGGSWSVGAYVGDLGLSTFDDDVLTRLVLLAHERAYRLSITASRPKSVRINIYARARDRQEMPFFHPTIDEAIDKFQLRDEVSWPREMTERIIAGAPAVERCRHCGCEWRCPECDGHQERVEAVRRARLGVRGEPPEDANG